VTSTARSPGKMSRRGGSGPTAYDFRRPIKLSREHVRTLQIAFETYARSCGTLLTTRLRVVSSVTLASIEQLNYDEYVASLENPTLIAVVSIDPLSGTVLLELSSSKLKEIEYNAQFLRAHQPGDAVVVASFDMKIGAEDCMGSICLPFNSILPVLERQETIELTAAERTIRDVARRNLTAGLSAAPIDVAVRFQPIRMRTDDIVDLRPGDVVPLGHPTSRPLEVTVNETVFAYAVPGNQGARLACLIVPTPQETPAKKVGRS
jgi:flagellar motor switch protein FliM